MNEVTSTSALISNTMLCDVSRVLESNGPKRWSERQKASLRVIDLLSLIEAVAIHDTLYTLPAKLPGDADSLGLRQALIKADIVKVLDTSKFHNLFQTLQSSIFRLKNWEPPEELFYKLGQRERRNFDFFERNVSRSFSNSAIDETFEMEYFRAGNVLNATSLDECLKLTCMEIYLGQLHPRSGGVDEQEREREPPSISDSAISVIREMHYVITAEAAEIPYWPQYVRRSFTSRFPNYLDKKPTLELYRKLATAFKCTVTEIYDDHKEELVFVPPFASLVLSRSNSPVDVIERLLEVRSEYSDLRSKLSELELERNAARTIGKRLKIRKDQRNLLNELSLAFDKPDVINLEGILRYAPNLAEPLSKPSDLSSYKPDLITMPIKQLVRWWKRRPIAKFFVLADKLKKTEDYPHLITRVFGKDAVPDPSYLDLIM